LIYLILFGWFWFCSSNSKIQSISLERSLECKFNIIVCPELVTIRNEPIRWAWPLMPKSFLEFLHIFAYIIINIYYLSQFHQIHHTNSVVIVNLSIGLDEWEVLYGAKCLKLIYSMSGFHHFDDRGIRMQDCKTIRLGS